MKESYTQHPVWETHPEPAREEQIARWWRHEQECRERESAQKQKEEKRT